MPIHLRANPGDYAPNVLCPGDPRRATYVAETLFDDARCVNEERGMLGYTGTFEGQPISVQSTGMGGPSAAIVFEELVQLGVKRIVRIGTCGALMSHMRMADVVIAMSATALDSTTSTYTMGEAHTPTASYRLLERAVNEVRNNDLPLHVGPIATSDVFYDPDLDRFKRLAARGHLAIEMEAATLYTVAAIRGIEALAMMTVSDELAHSNDGSFERITDEDLKRGVDQMMAIAARVCVS
jgi:5'-methylthioadenosine phosphorylase/purine-nucleoside phosphorylase